jgi:hypothetical protein
VGFGGGWVMCAGRCSLSMSGRSRWAGAALLACLELGMLPSVARAQEGTSGGTQPPTPAQGELPEVKVEAPKVEIPKAPPKPAVVEKPARPEEPVARRVATPKPRVTPKPAATPVRVAEPVAAPPLPSTEPIAATSDLVDVSPVAGSGIDRDKIPANVPQPMGPQDFEHSKAPDLLQSLTRSLPFTSLENQSGNQFQQVSTIAALWPRQYLERRKASPSIRTASASTKPTATSSTGRSFRK